MQKKGLNVKKGRKYIFNFEIHTKNIKKGKKKAHLFWFFFVCICAFFCISDLKIHIKKDKNAKKSIKIFSNCKNKHAKKKHEIIFQKKVQKKSRNAKKKMQKKRRGGVYDIVYMLLNTDTNILEQKKFISKDRRFFRL